MKLILREYLATLPESGGLDSLLPDLLLAAGIAPLSRAQVGVRQYGVDVAAHGPDPHDGRPKLFLFSLKAGDIDRASWDSGKPQDVRSSLNEILDVYLKSHVPSEYANAEKVVVLCCGGERKQEVDQNWSGYVADAEQQRNITFQFWGGDKLALLIENHLLDARLLPASARSDVRRALALIGSTDYDLRDYYSALARLLIDESNDGAKSVLKRDRHIAVVCLLLGVVASWAVREDNARAALLAAERTMLWYWEWARRNNCLADVRTMSDMTRLYSMYRSIATVWFNRVQPHCVLEDGLAGYAADSIEYPLRVFETIGHIALFGLALRMEEEESEDAEHVVNVLASLIDNNPPAKSPRYDQHAIDIGLAVIALSLSGKRQETEEWIVDICHRSAFAYKLLGHSFPVCSDSFDDLLELHFQGDVKRDEMIKLSTLLPMLAELAALLDLPEAYSSVVEVVRHVFPNTSLQQWHPDADTECVVYREFAANESGETFAPINLRDSVAKHKELIRALRERVVKPDILSCIERGWPLIAFMASRHFRTPLMPCLWRGILVADEEEDGQVSSAGSS